MIEISPQRHRVQKSFHVGVLSVVISHQNDEGEQYERLEDDRCGWSHP